MSRDGLILICAATTRELKAITRDPVSAPSIRAWEGMVTGVGIPLTLARLLPVAAARRPDFIINIGIAGAYPGSGLVAGDLVLGASEVFGDMGMETPEAPGFIPLRDAPWADAEYREPIDLVTAPFAEDSRPIGLAAKLGLGISALKLGRGCTVNACAGRAETGRLREKLFSADFESMEGAAFALVGRLLSIPVCEVRAISNIAADRDMRPENLEIALRNLGVYMDAWLGRDR